MAAEDLAGRRLRPVTRVVPAGIALLAITACGGPETPSILDPRGPAAQRVAGLWWFLFWVSVVVFVVVMVLLGMALARRNREEEEASTDEPRWAEPGIVVAGVVIPVVLLAVAFLVSLRDMNALARLGEETTMTVEVIGHDWWWEARYPNGAVTANELHVPVGERVRVDVTTADVIHSFWVPQLQVKIDMIPGRVNSVWIEADAPGRFRGLCGEFCGLQHTNMQFFVIAEPAADFEAWVENEAAPAATPAPGSTEEEGLDVFLSTTCFGCHAIRGTEAEAVLGPDLTHLADRETLFALTVPNTRENLTRAVVDPQAIKPGAVMPPTELTERELVALVAYMESLE